jgi:hypothetical protein
LVVVDGGSMQLRWEPLLLGSDAQQPTFSTRNVG